MTAVDTHEAFSINIIADTRELQGPVCLMGSDLIFLVLGLN